MQTIKLQRVFFNRFMLVEKIYVCKTTKKRLKKCKKKDLNTEKETYII